VTTLADDLVPDQLWALVEPLLPTPPRPPYGGRHRTISNRACSPRSCTWPAPPLRGGCCPPASWAAAPRRPAGAASPSGPTPGCSTPCTFGFWTALVNKARWTGSGRAWTRRACGPNAGGPRGRKSSRSWQAGVQAAAGLRRERAAADRGGDRGQRQRHHRVPGRLDDVPPIRTPAGQRRTRPAKVHADKGYDSRANRAYLRGVGSSRGSLGVRSSRRSGLGATVGRSSGRCRG
jgi:hypothetical protein